MAHAYEIVPKIIFVPVPATYCLFFISRLLFGFEIDAGTLYGDWAQLCLGEVVAREA